MIPEDVSLNDLGSVPVSSLRTHFLPDDVFLCTDDGVRSLGVQNRVRSLTLMVDASFHLQNLHLLHSN